MITIKPENVNNTYCGLVLSSENLLKDTYFGSDYKNLPGNRIQAIKLSIFPQGRFYFGKLNLIALYNELNKRAISQDLEELVQQREYSITRQEDYIYFYNDSRDLVEFGFSINTSTKKPDFLLRKNQELSKKFNAIIYSLEFGHHPTNPRMIASQEQFQTEIQNTVEITQDILNKTNTSPRYPYNNPKINLSLKPIRKIIR